MTETGNTGPNDALHSPPTVQIPAQTGAATAPGGHLPSQPAGPAATTQGPVAAQRPRRALWLVGTAALLVGLLAGAAVGIVATRSDPTKSQQYRSLAGQLSSTRSELGSAQSEISGAKATAEAAEQSANQVAAAAAAREGQLDQQAAAVSAAAASLSQAQAAINANTITEGTWTVGTDIQPGRYRTTAPVEGDCYWEIDRAGGGIVQNDIVTGGFPTVSLAAGQVFKTERCGDWLKQ